MLSHAQPRSSALPAWPEVAFENLFQGPPSSPFPSVITPVMFLFHSTNREWPLSRYNCCGQILLLFSFLKML